MSRHSARVRSDEVRVKVLVAPKDQNPYQSLLYEEVEREGAVVRYSTGPTRSQSVNVLLSPAMLLAYRSRGFNVLHLHWVFQFSLPWTSGALSRLAMQWWFRFYLWFALVLGYRIVWTAHDILPHGSVFYDDERAHAVLRDSCDVVIALSNATRSQLLELGARDVRVIPMGPYHAPYEVTIDRAEARRRLALDDEDFVVVSLGRVEWYKGIDLLLEAAVSMGDESRVVVLVGGACSDEALRARLLDLARRAGRRARLVLERIPDQEVASYFVAADVAAYPFREVTNSSSIYLAQSFGVPVVIPDLPSLADVPRESAIRFGRDKDTLVEALRRAEEMGEAERSAMGGAARSYAGIATWRSVGEATMAAYLDALGRPRARPERRRAVPARST